MLQILAVPIKTIIIYLDTVLLVLGFHKLKRESGSNQFLVIYVLSSRLRLTPLTLYLFWAEIPRVRRLRRHHHHHLMFSRSETTTPRGKAYDVRVPKARLWKWDVQRAWSGQEPMPLA